MKISKNRDRPMDSQGCDLLRLAVVERACSDYLTAGPRKKSLIRTWFLDPVFAFWGNNLRPHDILNQLDHMRAAGQTQLYSMLDTVSQK